MRTSPISPAVRKAFYEHRTVLKSERAHPIDYLISYACFVFELVYHQSALIARKQGHVFELLSYRSDNPDTDSQLAQMREHMRSWPGRARLGRLLEIARRRGRPRPHRNPWAPARTPHRLGRPRPDNRLAWQNRTSRGRAMTPRRS